MLEELKADVCRANLDLVAHGLVTLTWGNVSGFDPASKLVVIKPSGVAYTAMQPADMVVVDLDGKVVEGELRPSSDTPTHVRLYRAFGEGVGGVTHTHSTHATMFAQARAELPCYGTTHADHFHGPVPVTRCLAADEVADRYEAATGDAIVECFAGRNPLATPAVFVAGHAAFVWGESPARSVENAVALEAVAQMAIGTRLLGGAGCPTLEDHVLQKHHTRKHGPDAYYGQHK